MYFLTLRKNIVEIFLKGISLSLKNSWNPNNFVLSPHAAGKNCIKRGRSVQCEESSPTELYSPGLKYSVMLDPQICPGVHKTARTYEKTKQNFLTKPKLDKMSN